MFQNILNFWFILLLFFYGIFFRTEADIILHTTYPPTDQTNMNTIFELPTNKKLFVSIKADQCCGIVLLNELKVPVPPDFVVAFLCTDRNYHEIYRRTPYSRYILLASNNNSDVLDKGRFSPIVLHADESTNSLKIYNRTNMFLSHMFVDNANTTRDFRYFQLSANCTWLLPDQELAAVAQKKQTILENFGKWLW